MACKYFRTIQLYQDDETEDIETDLGDNEDVSQPENEDESLRLQPYSGTRRIVPTLLCNQKKCNFKTKWILCKQKVCSKNQHCSCSIG